MFLDIMLQDVSPRLLFRVIINSRLDPWISRVMSFDIIQYRFVVSHLTHSFNQHAFGKELKWTKLFSLVRRIHQDTEKAKTLMWFGCSVIIVWSVISKIKFPIQADDRTLANHECVIGLSMNQEMNSEMFSWLSYIDLLVHWNFWPESLLLSSLSSLICGQIYKPGEMTSIYSRHFPLFHSFVDPHCLLPSCFETGEIQLKMPYCMAEQRHDYNARTSTFVNSSWKMLSSECWYRTSQQHERLPWHGRNYQC